MICTASADCTVITTTSSEILSLKCSHAEGHRPRDPCHQCSDSDRGPPGTAEEFQEDGSRITHHCGTVKPQQQRHPRYVNRVSHHHGERCLLERVVRHDCEDEQNQPVIYHCEHQPDSNGGAEPPEPVFTPNRDQRGNRTKRASKHSSSQQKCYQCVPRRRINSV